MRANILSLKNLYNFLTVKDYPVYSMGIIGREQKKGITLIKFWRENLVTEFTGGKYGKLIWKETGYRNRYTSEICNRSRQLTIYEEYMTEFVMDFNAEVALQQIEQFRIFLVNHQFSYKVFALKLKALLKEFEENDSSWNREIKDFFEINYQRAKSAEQADRKEKDFIAAWFLTFLSIHALAGEAMEAALMHAVRDNAEYGTEALWDRLHKQKDNASVTYISTKKCEICREALSTDHFYGREKEYFDLKEKIGKDGKYLISGIGGIGKTELLRQVLRYCVNNRKVQYICTIQYENNFAESLLRALGKKQQQDVFQENFAEAVSELKYYGSRHRLLLLIDNINKDSEEDDSLKAIAEIPAVIFATSRLSQIEGFKTYPLKELDKQSCELVFRDNYTKELTEEDITKLYSILEHPLYRHTMTIRWLGHVASSMKLSVTQLVKTASGQTENKRDIDSKLGLQNIYKELYSKLQLNNKQCSFLKILASMPYRRYRTSFLCHYMDYFMNKEADTFLQNLSRQGWIDLDENGAAMHPVIAESILDEPLTYNELQCLLKEVEKKWMQMFGNIYEYANWKDARFSFDMDFVNSAELVTDMFDRMPDDWSKRFIPMIVLAAEVIRENYAVSPEHLSKLKKIVTEGESISDDIRIRGYLVCAECMTDDSALLKKELEQQKNHRTVEKETFEHLLNLTAQSFSIRGDFQTAEKYLKDTDIESAGVERILQLGNLACINVKIPEALEWNRKAIQKAEKEKDTYTTELFQLWGMQTALYSGMQNNGEAEKSISQMEQYMRKDNVQENWYYGFQKGVYLLSVNRLPEALKSLEKARKYAGYYFGEEHINYALESEEIAITQAKLKMYDKAEENHILSLHYVTEHEGLIRERGRILNNMGVMYLDWGKKSKAFHCLQTAYELMEENNDLSMAEPAYNLARWYRMENNSKKELYYLEKAYPVFQKFYTDENEKTKEVRQRLTEIRG